MALRTPPRDPRPAPADVLTQQSADYVRIDCERCGNLLYARMSQIGQKIVCPDCNTSSTVQPPHPPPTKRPFALPDENYRLVTGSGQPPPDSQEAYALYLTVNCPLCGTLLRPRLEEAGRQIECPDCGKTFAVPVAKEPENRPARVNIDEIDGYELGEPVERTKLETFDYDTDTQDFRDIEGLGGRRERKAIVYDRPPPPARPFSSGILFFPCYAGSRGRWFSLSASGIIVLLMLGQTLQFASVPKMWIFAMLTGAATLILFVGWFVVTAIVLLSIVEETAAGNELVEGWPDLMFLDWIMESLYLVNSIALSALVGVMVAKSGAAIGMPPVVVGTVVAIAVWIAFPFLLLSMLEVGSPMVPFSEAVAVSLVSAWRGWAIVLLQTSLMAAAWFGSLWLLAGFWVFPDGFMGQLPVIRIIVFACIAMTTFVPVLMIYCRLLGRLGWYCSEVVFLPDKEDQGPESNAE